LLQCAMTSITSKLVRLVGGVSGCVGVGTWVSGRNLCQAEETLPWYKDSVEKNKIVSLSWLLDKNEKDTKLEDQSNNKVLLLSYVRSGSTFTAEVLASSPATSYYMEPLFALMPLGQLDWDYFLEGAITDSPEASIAVRRLMEGIFQCEEEVVRRLEDWGSTEFNIIAADTREKCMDSRNVLVKTVRLHADNLEPWIHQSDVKIVHLVRDPRAMISSMLSQKEEWGDRLSSFKRICEQVHQDMELGRKLPSDKYLMVKYEDIVENPQNMFEKICAFTGIEFNEKVKQEINRKVSGDASDEETTKYYSTTRSAQFKHDSWKQKLDRKLVEEIQCDCSELLNVLGYKKI